MKNIDWDNIRKILVMRLDNIGDVIMTGPALRALKEALPRVHLTLMASPAGSQVAPMLPWVDECIVDRTVWQDASGAMPLDPDREFERVADLRSRRFDAVLILTSFSQSPYPPAYAAYLAGIPVRIGSSKEFGGSVLSHWQKSPPDEIHQVDRNLALLEYAGIPQAGSQMELNVPIEIQVQADNLLQSYGVNPLAPYILAAPGASCSARRYDPQRFAAAVHLLQQQTHLPVVLVGSERERELIESFHSQTNGVISLVGRTSIQELAWVIRRSALVLANDSAPMHLADVFLRPLVVLYSGTELESQWQPRHTRSRLLRRPTECSPCYQFRCPYGMECLDIPAEEVAAEALVLLFETTQIDRVRPALI